MSLYTQLQAARSEEDVKDAYIKALGLKGYTKGLIDIQSKEIWFEAKDTGKNSSYAMFTQLLHYVQVALNEGETVPPFLAVIDTEKAALMRSADVLPFLAKKTIKWGKSASQFTQAALDEISAHIGTHFVAFKIATHEQEFISTVNADNIKANGGDKAESKSGVSKTHVAAKMDKQGYASRELFVQFLARIAKEIPTATVAVFSKIIYINAPNFEKFREDWNAKFLSGFVVHSQAFDGLKGNFPSGFLIWATNQRASTKQAIADINTEVLDKNGKAIGEKCFYNLPDKQLLSNWIIRPRSNDVDALPLKNAVTPTTSTKDVRGRKSADGAIGGMIAPGGDIQHAGLTALLSSGYCSAGGFFVTDKNPWQSAIVFAARRLIKQTWLNDRDQFLIPAQPLTDEFKNDCLIWMLFNGSNLTASANNLEWNNKKWSIVNHFIPFTEAEVNATDRFESDFMVQYLADKTLSPEATAVLAAGCVLWQAYFAHTAPRKVRDQFKLNRADVGWYQIRNALAARNQSGDAAPVSFAPLEEAYETLTDKLRPQVFSLGFLR